MHSTILFTLFSLVVPYVTAAGVTTTAICSTDPWTTNEKGQSPCLVTSALQAACDGGNFNVPDLTTGQTYFGPELGFGNVCTCSTVTYSMAMACAACQGAEINKWSVWMTNCTADQVSIGLFPPGIPSGITIPTWAYQNVTILDLWNVGEALTTANEHQPDSSAVPQPTASSNNPSGTGSTGSSNGGKSNTNIGAIVGGVVGGIAVIVLIVVAVFFIRRRSNKARTDNSASAHVQPWTPNEQEKFLQPNNNSPYQDYSPPPPSSGLTSVSMPMVQPEPIANQFKPYNPSDPSTFPVTPMPSQGTPSIVTDPTAPPSSGSLRNFQLQPQLIPPMPGLPYNSSNPNLTAYPPNTTGASYAAPSTRSGHTYVSNSQGGHIQGQPTVLDPSQYQQQYHINNNASYTRGPYAQQPGSGGGYTGVAEIP